MQSSEKAALVKLKNELEKVWRRSESLFWVFEGLLRKPRPMIDVDLPAYRGQLVELQARVAHVVMVAEVLDGASLRAAYANEEEG